MQTSHQTTAFHEPLFLHDYTLPSVAPTLGGGTYNRAYLATADASAQIHRFARNLRYAQPLSEIP